MTIPSFIIAILALNLEYNGSFLPFFTIIFVHFLLFIFSFLFAFFPFISHYIQTSGWEHNFLSPPIFSSEHIWTLIVLFSKIIIYLFRLYNKCHPQILRLPSNSYFWPQGIIPSCPRAPHSPSRHYSILSSDAPFALEIVKNTTLPRPQIRTVKPMLGWGESGIATGILSKNPSYLL